MVRKGQKLKFSVSSVVHEDSKKSFINLRDEKLQRSIDRNLENGGVNNKYLNQYYAFCKSNGDMITTLDNKMKVMKYFFGYTKKDAKIIKRKDVEDFLANGWKKQTLVHYPNGNIVERPAHSWKNRTLNLYKIQLKHFFWWFDGCKKLGSDKVYPEIVNWIEVRRDRKEFIDDIMTKEEILKLMENAVCLRDKCIISVLYDGALRISELAGLRIKDIEFDEYGARIKINGKTGERKVRLVESVPLLKQWVDEHPYKNNVEKELFICLRARFGKPLVASSLYKVIESVVKRAGITKKIYPHLFRHTRLTHLAKEGLNESELRIFAGWTKASPMPEVYLHISEKDLDDKLIRKSGMLSKEEQERFNKIKEMEEKKLKPVICPQCKEINVVGSKFCIKCGIILDRVQAERIIKKKQKKEKEVMQLGYMALELSQSNKFWEFVKMFKATGGLSKKQLSKMEEQIADKSPFEITNDEGMEQPIKEVITKAGRDRLNKAWNKR